MLFNSSLPLDLFTGFLLYIHTSEIILHTLHGPHHGKSMSQECCTSLHPFAFVAQQDVTPVETYYLSFSLLGDLILMLPL